MKPIHVLMVSMVASLLCGAVLVVAPPAQAEEECFEIEIRTSPVHGRSGDRLDCRVQNITEDDLWVGVKHKDEYDETLKSEGYNLGDDEFASSTLMVPFPSQEISCEVEVVACYPRGLSFFQIRQAIVLFPPVRVRSVRRENQEDHSGTEGTVTEIEPYVE